MGKTVRFLYRLARLANDIETLVSLNPLRIARRIKNKVVGRNIISRVWRFPF